MLLDAMASKVLLLAWDRWCGNHASRYQTEARSILNADLSTVRSFQLKRIRTICQHAFDHTKFYRDRFKRAGIRGFAELTWEEFEQIPILTKAELQEHLHSLISDVRPVAELRKSKTGGTTSSPTTIYMDWAAHDRRWAATYEWDRRIGHKRGQRIAYLWGASQDFDAHPSWKRKTLNRFVTGALYLPASPLDERTMLRHYEALRRWKLNCLQAYPTPLSIFADFLVRNNLSLDIPVLTVTAETLQQVQIEHITKTFGRRPFNWYGAREAGRIATECEYHQGMHVNVYGLHVEIDLRNNYFSPGLGSIIITDLWNVGMPLIRYEIGDLGSITEVPCVCGSALPRILSLEGRVDDVFINSAGQRIPGVSIVNRIAINNSEIREMKIVQTALGQFDLFIAPARDWGGELTEQLITAQLAVFMQEPVATNFCIVDFIPREPSGKVQFCKNMIDGPTSF
jgi:phenylacetate-CoA ligase